MAKRRVKAAKKFQPKTDLQKFVSKLRGEGIRNLDHADAHELLGRDCSEQLQAELHALAAKYSKKKDGIQQAKADFMYKTQAKLRYKNGNVQQPLPDRIFKPTGGIWSATVKILYRAQWKGAPMRDYSMPFTLVGKTKQELLAKAERDADAFVAAQKEDYKMEQASFRPNGPKFDITFTQVPLHLRDPTAAAHKQAGAPHMDTLPPSDWDMHDDLCFPRYVMHEFGRNSKGRTSIKKYVKSVERVLLCCLGIDCCKLDIKRGSGNKQVFARNVYKVKRGRCTEEQHQHAMRSEFAHVLTAEQIAAVQLLIDNGVQTLPHISSFCEVTGISCYASVEDYKPYWTQKGEKRSRALIYHTFNNHLYPVSDELLRASVLQRGKGRKSAKGVGTDYARVMVNRSQLEEGFAANPPAAKVKLYDVSAGHEFIGHDNLTSKHDKMMALLTQVDAITIPSYKNGIQRGEKGLCSFTINNTTHMLDTTQEEINRLSKVYQPYQGQTYNTILFDAINTTFPKGLPTTLLNPHAYDRIVGTPEVKVRGHVGVYPGIDSLDREALVQDTLLGQVVAADVSKNYGASTYFARDDWLIGDYFNTSWEPYDDTPVADLRLGLYLTHTDDATLLKGTNLYDRKILQEAARCNIPFTLTHQFVPKEGGKPAGFFRPLLQCIVDSCHCDPLLYKLVINMFTGYLGKHEHKVFTAMLTTDPQQAWAYLGRCGVLQMEDSKRILFEQLQFDDGTPAVLYGTKTARMMTHTNVLAYIQMRCWAVLMVHDMTVKMGGTPLFRKVDCVVSRHGRLPTAPVWDAQQYRGDCSDAAWQEISRWGGYKQITAKELPKDMENPEAMHCLSDEEVAKYYLSPWEVHRDVYDSDDWEDMVDILLKHRGLQLNGRAGTGKTWSLLNMRKALRARGLKVQCLAFTNKATLNLTGRTIHGFLQLSRDQTWNDACIQKVKGKKVDVFIVDETSMIPGHLWHQLCELKRQTGAIFVLAGDKNQCPPVESDRGMTHYFDHEAVKFLAAHQRVELSVCKRYDSILWDVSGDIMDGKAVPASMLGTQMCRRNVCYYTATKQHVNHLWMKREAPEEHLYAPALPDDPETQDTWLYPGLPIIGTRNVNAIKEAAAVPEQEAPEAPEEEDELSDWFMTDDPAETEAALRALAGEVQEEDELPKRLMNNESFVVDSIDLEAQTCWVESQNRPGHTLEVKLDEFHEQFEAAYCTTVYCAQGDTWDEPFTIWDWEGMSKELKYTAITRAKREKGCAVPLDQQVSLANVDRRDTTKAAFLKLAKAKAASAVAADKAAGREHSSVERLVECMVRLRARGDGQCCNCGIKMLFHGYKKGDVRQFSLDRNDDDIGHLCSNSKLGCWGCNRDHVKVGTEKLARKKATKKKKQDEEEPVVHEAPNVACFPIRGSILDC